MHERVIAQGIELPDLLAGRRIESHHAEISCGEVHHAVDHDRSAFDRLAGAAFELACVKSPGRFEPRHVFTVDLAGSDTACNRRHFPRPASQQFVATHPRGLSKLQYPDDCHEP